MRPLAAPHPPAASRRPGAAPPPPTDDEPDARTDRGDPQPFEILCLLNTRACADMLLLLASCLFHDRPHDPGPPRPHRRKGPFFW